MKRLLAGAMTAAVMGVFLWSGLRGGGSGPESPPAIASRAAQAPEPSSPLAAAESRVCDLLAAGRRGDVESYLAAFTGALRDRILGEIRDRGPDRFADDLRRAASARKSHAIFAAEADGPDACRIVVEAVYPDRNERQTYHLERTPSGWLVAAVELVRSHLPEERYGSPAGFMGSEDSSVPVVGVGSE